MNKTAKTPPSMQVNEKLKKTFVALSVIKAYATPASRTISVCIHNENIAVIV